MKFCNDSAKPLLFAGAFLSFCLAVIIGYTGCTTQALFNLIDSDIAQSRSLSYYIQLGVAFYLLAVAFLCCIAAQYDQKHCIRGVSNLLIV